ncbi:MAG: MFS transporter [Opitutaceae bacterium]|nr:MFS transporter [Opitutaceae bacterium]
MHEKKSLFILPDGRNVVVTFILVSSLFLLWGFCNGMIDTMDKHFQDQLHLTKAQSAWVQFAHYMGYSIMALPAGLMIQRTGYKWGIIVGLAMVAVGGFWFIPATHISTFWAFLLGVCAIAMGLTVLETVANPYTTVLGGKDFAATRINLAQSFNGVGWILGPVVGGAFFYSDQGHQVAHGQLWIPYAGVGVVVLVLAVLFFFAPVPELKVEDEYHTDAAAGLPAAAARPKHPGLVALFLFLNVVVLAVSLYLVLNAILPFCGVSPAGIRYVTIGIAVAALLTIPSLLKTSRTITEHSIWAHPHFAGATVAQFLYVAAQAGIFSFFINYVISEMPAISQSVANLWPLNGRVIERDGALFVTEQGASRLQGFVAFLLFTIGRFVGSAILKRTPAHRVLGLYAAINVVLCGVVALDLGWISVAAVFLSFYFMSIMFPTVFALGIHGLGAQAKKKAAAFIVMAITGGALMPKIMGHLGDVYSMATSFMMPFGCFIGIAIYGFIWPKLSGHTTGPAIAAGKGH